MLGKTLRQLIRHGRLTIIRPGGDTEQFGELAAAEPRPDVAVRLKGALTTSGSLTFQDWKAGWTAGAGIETAMGNGWSAKLEYLYMDLGKTESTIVTPGLGTLAATSRRFTDNIVRVGFNYKWGGGGYGGSYGGGY
jgi:opacity protein-like surface antigen